jgi:hypothetical protein
MLLKTFGDIVTLTKNLINQTDADEQIDIIVRTAINNAYMNELAKIDKRVIKTFVPIIDGVATLPDDILSIESLSPELNPGDSKIGNAILTSLEGTFTLVYSYTREPLVDDTEEPDLNSKYFYPLALYGAYAYYKHRKKSNEEQSFYSSYRQAIEDLKPNDNLPSKIKDVYNVFGGW